MSRIDHSTSSTVHAAIARRYSAPQWATFFEVRDDAGFNARRSADAIAVNTWPSMGLAIHGFEVKVSRADFLREMKEPEKSAAIQRFCDHWWLAVSDTTIAAASEVPANWGLLVLTGKKLVTKKQAPKLAPLPLDRGFVASLLRRATEHMVPKAVVDEQVTERVEQEVKRRIQAMGNEGERAIAELAQLKAQLAGFYKATGLEPWEAFSSAMYCGTDQEEAKAEELGNVIRYLTRGRPGHFFSDNHLAQLKHCADGVRRVTEEFEKLRAFEQTLGANIDAIRAGKDTAA